MAKLWVKTLNITSNPSGAASAARQGNVVMIIDVIDMSTTAEMALELGAINIFGASPPEVSVPVTINPEKIGYIAGKKALKHDTGVIVAAEPRIYKNKKTRMDNSYKAIKGIKRAGGELDEIIPNSGKDIDELADFEGKIVVIVSSAGGVAYDAAYNYGAPEVITGTVARTEKMKGSKPALKAAKRAIQTAAKYKCGITIVASSSNSLEDVLAANFIGQKIIDNGFLQVDVEKEE